MGRFEARYLRFQLGIHDPGARLVRG